MTYLPYRLETAGKQFICFFQDGIGHRSNMRIDPFEFIEDIHMDGTGINTLDAVDAKARQMIFRRGPFQGSETRLFGKQPARHFHFTGYEYSIGQFQIFQQLAVEFPDFQKPLFGKLKLVPNFFSSQFHQVVIDNVPDMFQVDGE